MAHIRIISPSGTINPDYIDGATQRLQTWGFEVSEGKHARGEFGRFSGTDEERLADIHDALEDPSVDIILCARGGYGLQRIIDKIQISDRTDIVRASFVHRSCIERKCLVGFSDITALHQLWALGSTPSLHGLMCKHLTELPEDSETLRYMRAALDGEPLSYHIPPHSLNRIGEASGTLVGGNLSVLYGLQGTPFSLQAVIDAHPEGVILFIEDIAERHYHIDRMMNNLRLSGILAQIKGLVVGQFTDCEDDPLMGCSVYDTIRQAVKPYDYPVLFNFPAGHTDYNLPLRLNTPTTITINNDFAWLSGKK